LTAGIFPDIMMLERKDEMLTLYERNVVEEILNALLENLSPLSRESYRASIVSFLRFSIARKQANPFQSPVSVFTSYKTELKKEYAPATVNKKLSAVREFFRYAYIHELITHEMYEGIRLVSNVRQSGEAWREWLDEDEARALLEKADLLRDKIAIVLMMIVGLRREEAVSVRWEQLIQQDGVWLLANVVGKGNKIRHPEIPDRYIPLFQLWREDNYKDYILVSIDRHGNLGDKLNKTSLNKIMKKYDVRPHDLRRTSAKLADDGGAPIRAIQKQLGHSSVKTTEIYMEPMRVGESAVHYIKI